MFEFIEWLEGCIVDIGESAYDIVENTEELLENLNNYIEFSTYYIWISGIVLGVLFIMLCVVLSNQKKIKAQNESIIKKLDCLNSGEPEREAEPETEKQENVKLIY